MAGTTKITADGGIFISPHIYFFAVSIPFYAGVAAF